MGRTISGTARTWRGRSAPLADNGIGIAGINWRVQLMSLKFLDANGSGYISDAVLAFDQVTALKQQGVNVRLTNNSWGGGGFSQSLKDAMARGEAAGILHVCAAGNSNQNADASPMYPAAYDNRGIISVLASDQSDAGASFTNYGLASVDIAAPGVSTLSTVPMGTCTLCDPSGYKLLSGTSMAAPHVSGVLAALFHRTRRSPRTRRATSCWTRGATTRSATRRRRAPPPAGASTSRRPSPIRASSLPC